VEIRPRSVVLPPSLNNGTALSIPHLSVHHLSCLIPRKTSCLFLTSKSFPLRTKVQRPCSFRSMDFPPIFYLSLSHPHFLTTQPHSTSIEPCGFHLLPPSLQPNTFVYLYRVLPPSSATVFTVFCQMQTFSFVIVLMPDSPLFFIELEPIVGKATTSSRS